MVRKICAAKRISRKVQRLSRRPPCRCHFTSLVSLEKCFYRTLNRRKAGISFSHSQRVFIYLKIIVSLKIENKLLYRDIVSCSRWAKVVVGGWREDGDELYREIITRCRCNWETLLSSLSARMNNRSRCRQRELKICCHNSRHLLQPYLDFGAAAHTRDRRMRCP